MTNIDRENNKESIWEINCDGYYPYCKKCGYEPDYAYLKNCDFNLPSICPSCQSKMLNTDQLNKK